MDDVLDALYSAGAALEDNWDEIDGLTDEQKTRMLDDILKHADRLSDLIQQRRQGEE